MKPYIIGHEAEEELIEALAYHARKWPNSGWDLHSEFMNAFELICRQPAGFPLVDDETRMRSLHPLPFVIYYLDLPDTVWISAIANKYKRFGYWRKRRPPRS